MKANFTVSQFCRDHNLGKTTFYKLVKEGRAPRLYRLGRKTLISAEAAADWQREMEGEPATAAPASGQEQLSA